MTRVGVTTTLDAAPALVMPLAGAGLAPVLLPCITVVPSAEADLDAARHAAAHADWIVVTSPRAVRITWPGGDMPAIRVAAVGPATAAAAAAAGGRVEIVGEMGGADLVRRLTPEVDGQTVVFPHARGAHPGTAAALDAAGALVHAVEVYATLPAPPDLDTVEAAVFASPSAVEGWCLARPLEDVTVAAIGPTTAAAVTARGGTVAVTAPRPGFPALAAALADHLRSVP